MEPGNYVEPSVKQNLRMRRTHVCHRRCRPLGPPHQKGRGTQCPKGLQNDAFGIESLPVSCISSAHL